MRASDNLKRPTPYVQSVQSAFRLLESLHILKRASLSQLSEHAGFSLNQTFRLLATLIHEGYVYRDSAKRYRLGAKLHVLGQGTDWLRNLVDRARPHMSKLSGLSGETVLVSVPVGLERMIVAQVPSTHSLQVNYPIGSCVPLYVGGMGVAMLAFLPETAEQVLASSLTAFTEQTLDRPRLVAELARVRTKGVRVSVDDYAVGEFSIAAPVLGGKNRAEAAITIAGFTARLDDKKREIYTVAVKEAAETLSLEIHFHTPGQKPSPLGEKL